MSNAFNELLAAAKAFADSIIVSPSKRVGIAHSRLRDAIAAAEREAAELAEPIDEVWLSKFSKQEADGFIIADAVDVWFGEHCNCWLVRGLLWGSAVKIESKGQLLSLLKGLGIEVAK